MDSKSYAKFLESAPTNQRHGLTSLRYGNCFMAVLALGTATSAFGAVEVPANSNLTAALNTATAESHEFELLGNVNMSTIFYQNTAARRNIYIDGKGYTITKSANANIFWITGSLQDAFLTIRNANITSVDSGSSYGTISIDLNAHNATIDLGGTRIYGTHGISGRYAGALTTHAQNTVVKGDVTFEANYGSGDAAGAVAVGHGAGASLIFEGETNFVNNHTVNYGGAVSVYTDGAITFKEKATFTGNYATTYFGGAIDAWTGTGAITFEKGAAFTGNHVKNSLYQAYGVRGGAINIGYLTGNDAPQLEMSGTSEFTGNYVWGYGNTIGIGGAIALSAAGANPLGNVNIDANHVYGADFERGIFTDNYAYSDNGESYGGAIFAKNYNSTLTFGSGSSFTGNAAKTLGGAIYFDQGTINLNGNITFSGNRHGATFSTDSGAPKLNAGSGTANAIYFAVSSNTATLNLNTGAGEVIHFADPIESAAGKTVTVNKTGSGTARFTGHDSDILAQTLVSEGTFELGDGVSYGRVGTAATSNFHLAAGATLRGGANATLRASQIQLDGRIEVQSGEFIFDGADVTLSETSVVALSIDSNSSYASINMGGHALALNSALLEVTASGYVPSQEISDTFTLVSNLSGPATGTFLQGDSITINGAEFEILYNANTITLQQLTVPEPATYALILAAGMVTAVWVRRQKQRRATAA